MTAMRILKKLLTWLGLLFGLPLLALWAMMAWDTRQLEADIEQVAASFTVGGSPFVMPLPADRIVMVSVAHTDSPTICARIAIRQGVVRAAEIGGQAVPLAFVQGIDLTPYAASLHACNRVSITLMATMSFFKGGFAMRYDGSQITDIDPPRLWD